MSLELVIDSTPSEVVIALLKDKKLVELQNEKSNHQFSVGDIFLAKVNKVIPSLNAAFVDVGYTKDAFLHYLDLGPQFSSLNKFVKSVRGNNYHSSKLDNFETEKDIDKGGKIKEIVSQGQEIIVQIAKEPISTKGPRLTSEISVAGRYIVLVPFSEKVSVSQKIKNPAERERLLRLVQSIKPKGFGIIIRTVAQSKKVVELHNDLNDLMTRWNTMYQKLKSSAPPKKILGELDRTSALLRDLLSDEFTNIHVNDSTTATEVKDYLTSVSPNKAGIVKEYQGRVPIFDHFGIQKQIKAAFGRNVSLNSGAYLIIEHTEAMHVIDVNSGNRTIKGQEQEQNALETNIEAAEEIARQLRLRDMGGIIVVDFIDMRESENRAKLHEKLKEFMKADKAKHTILPPSRFGLVEITRQRVRPEIEIKTKETCPSCGGTGDVKAPILFTDEIERSLDFLMKNIKPKELTICVHPFIEAFLTRGFRKKQRQWYFKYKKWIKILPLSSYQYLEYRFLNENDEEIKF
jgi:ribonuclease G